MHPKWPPSESTIRVDLLMVGGYLRARGSSVIYVTRAFHYSSSKYTVQGALGVSYMPRCHGIYRKKGTNAVSAFQLTILYPTAAFQRAMVYSTPHRSGVPPQLIAGYFKTAYLQCRQRHPLNGIFLIECIYFACPYRMQADRSLRCPSHRFYGYLTVPRLQFGTVCCSATSSPPLSPAGAGCLG